MRFINSKDDLKEPGSIDRCNKELAAEILKRIGQRITHFDKKGEFYWLEKDLEVISPSEVKMYVSVIKEIRESQSIAEDQELVNYYSQLVTEILSQRGIDNAADVLDKIKEIIQNNA